MVREKNNAYVFAGDKDALMKPVDQTIDLGKQCNAYFHLDLEKLSNIPFVSCMMDRSRRKAFNAVAEKVEAVDLFVENGRKLTFKVTMKDKTVPPVLISYDGFKKYLGLLV